MEVKPIIHSNIVSTMQTIIAEATNLGLRGRILDVEALTNFAAFLDEVELLPVHGAVIKALWEDPGIQATWDRRSEFQVVESIKGFFNEVDRICADNYIPTEQDLLQSRVRTTGIITEAYDIDGNTFEMYDVGGQRNERKKWIHCFESVTAVIFVAALSEYNQKLFEDGTCNRMIEALDLFEEIASSEYFKKSSLLLFLNKKDLFGEKISKVPITDTPEFSDYTGGSDYDAGVDYFVKQFKERFAKHGGDRELYHHCTCATDTKNIEVVFGVCKTIILQNSLKESGFM
jgi:hypothetical protein